MSKIEKTIARQKEKIDEGQFYEAHQQLRVIASRHVKSESYNAAIDLLAGGAMLLLRAGQGGSGGDLCLFLMDVYNKAELAVDAPAKARLFNLLRAYPPGEPTRKRFVGDMVSWSSKFGPVPAGDPEVHHVAGQLFAEEGDVYDAERHLLLGTRDSAPLLARLEYAWYAQDAPHTAPQYLARAVLPLLLVGNVRGANQAALLFTAALSAAHPQLRSDVVPGAAGDVRVYPSLPLLNFLALLLLAVRAGAADTFRALMAHYDANVRDTVGAAWDEALQGVAEMYFGIRKPRQSNPLMDMVGSMFGGGGGGGGARSTQKNVLPRAVEAPAPPPTLD